MGLLATLVQSSSIFSSKQTVARYKGVVYLVPELQVTTESNIMPLIY